MPDSHSSIESGAAPPSLHRYGWDDRWSAEFTRHAQPGLLPGRVLRVDRDQCAVVTPHGTMHADTEFVTPQDPLRMVCTGDWVAVDRTGDPPYVRTLLPRRTALVRSTSSKRSEGQVLAVNVDQILVAVSLSGEVDLGQLERFLVLAWESGAQPVLVLTKEDLVDDADHLRADAEAIAPGVPTMVVSALTGVGIGQLTALLTGGTAVLIGKSGAGKSSLANALLGEQIQAVNVVRDSDGKGRHTTIARDLHPLPTGGVLIDTPGVRGVGLWDAGAGVQQVFAEIEELAAQCRFHDCSHTAEPGCAVLDALNGGTLPLRRLESYRKLLRETEWIAARTNARLRLERRSRWKAREREGRQARPTRRR